MTTMLAHNSWEGLAQNPFGTMTGANYLSLWEGLLTEDIGSADPLNTDSDNDGMPDGWEVSPLKMESIRCRLDVNPVNGGDGLGDPDSMGCQIGPNIMQ